MPSDRAVKEHARIIRVTRGTRTDAQQHAAKGLVAQVQAIAQIRLKCWAVQEWEENVDAREEKVDEMIDQVWFWKGVTRGLVAKGCAFPLSSPNELGQRARY